MKNTNTGFTLIELLLVIALIAAMTISGVAFYRQRTTQLKIEKSALQMQQWLQAAMAYYVDEGHWPSDASQLLQDAHNPNANYYLPTSIKANPWGDNYQLKPVQDGRLIQVSAAVPEFSEGDPLAFAQRIAARLPNAQAIMQSAKPLVSAEVNIPGEVTNNNAGMKIIGIYKIPMPAASDYQVPKPTEQQCPAATMQAKVYYSLAAINNINPNSQVKHVLDTIDSEPGSNQWQPQLLVQMSRGPKHNKGTLIAIVTCEAKNKTIIAATICSNNPIIF